MPESLRPAGAFLEPFEQHGPIGHFRKFHGCVANIRKLLAERQGDVSALEMAEIIGRSARQAREIFHNIVGESFRVAQVRARLSPARELVCHTSTPICEIAESFGYSRRTKFDQSYSRVFGITPAADRLARRNQEVQKTATQGVDSANQQVYRADPTIEQQRGTMTRLTRVLLGLLLWASVAQAQTTIYWKKDYIRDASGAAIAVATPAPSDTSAPATPGSFQATSTTTTSVTLSWTDGNEGDLAGFVIYRGAVPVGAVGDATNSFTDLGLTAFTAYAYRVVSFDTAYNYSGYSSTVNVTTDAASGAPTGLTAIAASTSQVNLSWSAPGSGAPHHYGIWRRTSGSYSKIDTTSSTSYSNTGLTASTAYLYKISAENSSDVVAGWTNVDLATTILFTDDTITIGTTVIKAAHVTELRTAVNAVRASAGLSAASWTNASISGAWIKAVDITELRTALGDAITLLGLTAPNYTDSSLFDYTEEPPIGVFIKKAHIEQLRLRVK